MQRWEYACLSYGPSPGTTSYSFQLVEMGSSRVVTHKLDLTLALNLLGMEGWEVVEGRQDNGRSYLLKRQLSEEAAALRVLAAENP